MTPSVMVFPGKQGIDMTSSSGGGSKSIGGGGGSGSGVDTGGVDVNSQMNKEESPLDLLLKAAEGSVRV